VLTISIEGDLKDPPLSHPLSCVRSAACTTFSFLSCMLTRMEDKHEYSHAQGNVGISRRQWGCPGSGSMGRPPRSDTPAKFWGVRLCAL